MFDDSEFEQNLFKLRQEKLQEIVKLGQAAYPNRFPASPEAEAIAIPHARKMNFRCMVAVYKLRRVDGKW